MERSGRDPKGYALRTLRIGGAFALATAGGDVSGQSRELKRNRHAAAATSNGGLATSAAKILCIGNKDKGAEKQPGEGAVWGSRKRKRIPRTSQCQDDPRIWRRMW